MTYGSILLDSAGGKYIVHEYVSFFKAHSVMHPMNKIVA